jgi:hypothetical protein
MQIETLLQAKATADDLQAKAILEAMGEIKDDLKAVRKDMDADKAELAALKNKGTGILIGVALAAGGVGAGLSQFLTWLK